MAKLLNSIKAHIGGDRPTKVDQTSPFHLPPLEQPYKETVLEKYVLYNLYVYSNYNHDTTLGCGPRAGCRHVSETKIKFCTTGWDKARYRHATVA